MKPGNPSKFVGQVGRGLSPRFWIFSEALSHRPFECWRWMRQTRDRARLLGESIATSGITRKVRLQALEGDDATQTCVPRLIHLSHPARANRRDDLVRSEPASW